MNKYDSWLDNHEKMSKESSEGTIKSFLNKFQFCINGSSMDMSNIDDLKLFSHIINNISKYPQAASVILENLEQLNYNKESFIHCLLRNLNYYILEKNKEKVSSLIESFKLLSLVKDIRQTDTINNIDIYEIITNDGGCIKFRPAVISLEAAKMVLCECHLYSQLHIQKFDDYAVTLDFRPLFTDKRFYHSVILRGDNIIDISNNFVMRSEDYTKLFSPRVITKTNYHDLCAKVDDIEAHDEEFVQFKKIKLLKNAVYEDMKQSL